MESYFTTLIGLICAFGIKGIQASSGHITCRSDYSKIDCFGSGAYCCGVKQDECCWYNLYSYWWFWFVWFWVFILFMSCCVWVCVRRRRRARNGYMVVDSQPHSYGSVVSPGIPTGGNQPDYVVQPPVYSALPPSAPSYMQKPPPYSAVATQ